MACIVVHQIPRDVDFQESFHSIINNITVLLFESGAIQRSKCKTFASALNCD
jgi:hypothetical protein